MDNSLNQSIIEKVITKNVAIHIALNTMCPPPFEDKFKTESLCQKNTQTQNLEKSLNVVEPNNVNVANDTMNNTKTNLEEKSWKDITDPKLRKKMREKAYNKVNKDKIRLQKKDWEKNNKDKLKNWRKTKKHIKQIKDHVRYETYKDVLKLKHKAYNEANKDKISLYKKRWNEDNKDKIKLQKKNWNIKNKDKLKLQSKLYRREKIKTDIQYKLRINLRRRLWHALKGKYKAGSAVKDLGCTIEEFKVYLESKFQPGMSWDNWKYDGWHIDHIKPLVSFDLTDRKQMLEACHYTNLQPLWAKDNLSKSDKITQNSYHDN